jgi:hypothetical protein
VGYIALILAFGTEVIRMRHVPHSPGHCMRLAATPGPAHMQESKTAALDFQMVAVPAADIAEPHGLRRC